jgi:hypothetical protein
MLKRRINLALFVALVLSGIVTTVGAQSKSVNPNATAAKGRLEGTWLVTATFTSAQACDGGKCEPIDVPAPFQVLITFMAGTSEDEGTLVDTNEFQLTPNPVCTPDQGTWQRTGSRTFIATQRNFCFDATAGYLPAGPTKIRATFSVNDPNTILTGRQYIEGFDTSNHLVFIGQVNLQGPRIKAEAPPAQ